MTPNDKRLIEVAFPLKQTSLDSVHEKNVRHGHISSMSGCDDLHMDCPLKSTPLSMNRWGRNGTGTEMTEN